MTINIDDQGETRWLGNSEKLKKAPCGEKLTTFILFIGTIIILLFISYY